ncbi:MAG: CocE/NonD family hydrolase [Pseudomonadota bacterium]|nr:CocE/NonD family hydrolase [Pseudomonadota bacterium]
MSRCRRAIFGVILSLSLGAGPAIGQVDAEIAKFEALSESDTMVMVSMRDGVRLATDVYRPKGDGPFPTVLVKTPYNFNTIAGASLMFANEAIERGYAVVVQNERGRYYSEGEWEILGRPRTDGYDSLTWIEEQPWSDGKVATWGCSSTAEWQMGLAAQDHPAHVAMIPMASGAGIGRVGEYYEQGNWYKGGVHQTLFTVWLYGVQQNIRPQFPRGLSQEELQRLRKAYDLAPNMPEMDWATHMRTLPSVDWLRTADGNEGPGADFMRRKPNDPGWYRGGLYHDDEDFGVPAYWFNSWFDVSQGPNLALYNHARNNASDQAVRDGQYMMIAPTLHCAFYRTPKYSDYIAGDLNVGNAWYDYWGTIFQFLDYYVKEEDNGFHEETPRVRFYTMGRNQWQDADTWPPEDAAMMSMYLGSGGNANSVFGDGALTVEMVASGSDTFTYDPMNPVPSLGGGVCCNRGASLGGSFDQRGIEARADVLIYTSDSLEQAIDVTGFVRAKLFVSSDARDTDFTVKLVDVHPDGSAWNVDDTILRTRYREGYDKEVFMEGGEVYELNPTAMSTSYEFKAGHRIRVEVSSSKFPQYMRNLNTGGNNYDETEGVVVRNTIHHSAVHPSQIILPVRQR